MAIHCMKGTQMMRLTRWGHSIGLRLPCEVAQAAGLKPGDYVYVRLLDSGDIRVRPAGHLQPAFSEGEEGAAADKNPAVATKW
jgi:antitoxin MazE